MCCAVHMNPVSKGLGRRLRDTPKANHKVNLNLTWISSASNLTLMIANETEMHS